MSYSCIPLLLKESGKTCLYQEAHLSQETHLKQQEQGEEEVEEEEGEYEEEQANIIREAATLDDMAKLITVEEVSMLSCRVYEVVLHLFIYWIFCDIC